MGALTLVLEDAPYGPNVEEAKARTDRAQVSRGCSCCSFIVELELADTGIHLE